ncbi:unnamed protein product [Allacma fusca]|uniref:Uncharacterized protein n=1 Tax=Allacma fusca TaxID=39272 RepID=A0A8J2JW74_9HEXA|nr:unnamed protein product [Allacma fusca]
MPRTIDPECSKTVLFICMNSDILIVPIPVPNKTSHERVCSVIGEIHKKGTTGGEVGTCRLIRRDLSPTFVSFTNSLT